MSYSFEELNGKPVQTWPRFDVAWDFGPENFYRSLDGVDSDAFISSHPEGVVCVTVDLAELDATLCVGSKRSKDEVWGIRDDKVVQVIKFWIGKGKMSTLTARRRRRVSVRPTLFSVALRCIPGARFQLGEARGYLQC